MPDAHDDLDAIRTIVEELKPFEPEEQMRIVRWAFEKLGLHTVPAAQATPSLPGAITPTQVSQQSAAPAPTLPIPTPTNRDIKSFVAEKNPANDMQFSATIAYFYSFEAPEEQKKSEIGSGDLQEACRLTGRERLANPGQTLRNAAYNGLLDKGSDKGNYKINTVGENLVALTLPASDSGSTTKSANKRQKKKVHAKKPVKKTTKKMAKKSAKKTKKKKKA
jgi:hypothetical protein